MRNLVIASAIVVAFTSNAYAQDTSAGLMTVTGTVVSSISLTIESGAGAFSGGGTAAGTSALGDISKFGATPTGTTRVVTASATQLSASIGVKVSKANAASATYTLSALLGAALPTGTAWTLGGGTLSDVTPDVLTATGAYGATASYAWVIDIQDSVASGTSVANTINFTAVSN